MPITLKPLPQQALVVTSGNGWPRWKRQLLGAQPAWGT
jgi:hypothetical protein